MRLIAVSQRVDVVQRPGQPDERRDALDQRWAGLLAACGCTMLPLPNHPQGVADIWGALPFAGVLLTGGNDLAAYGGDAPERDATETELLRLARRDGKPVLGVCRGMQFLLDAFGVRLERVAGHAACRHRIDAGGIARSVNSYHHWAAREAGAAFVVAARSDDGGVEAVRHRSEPIAGIMWHPEREAAPTGPDIELIKSLFDADKP